MYAWTSSAFGSCKYDLEPRRDGAILKLPRCQKENESVKRRTASCCCGDLSITVLGVILCHCDYCQKRTGNVSRVSCWYFDHQIESRTGASGIFNEGPNNQGVDYAFCD